MTSIAITLLWSATCLASARAWLQHRAAGGASLTIAALFLTSLHLWSWNKPIYDVGRQLLIDAGVYEQRLLAKLVVGALLLLGALLLARPLLRWLARWPALLRVTAACALLDAAFVAVRTLSVDGWIPDALAFDPGKSALQVTLAACALLSAAFARPRRDDAPNPAPAFLE